MATSQIVSSLLRTTTLTKKHQNQIPVLPIHTLTVYKARFSIKVQAAKLPSGVIVPKVEPKFSPPFLGFTKIAETWNSRACMIGLIGTFIVELILGKGILQIIGVDVGKGLDLPL